MFQILYRAHVCAYEINKVSILGGMVATFIGNRKVGICRPGQLPIGFFMEDYPDQNFFDSSVMFPHGKVVVGIAEYKTDVFEPGLYLINDLLYCGEEGKITNSPIYRGNPIVGVVNNTLDNLIGFISAFGNLESVSKQEIKEEIKPPSKSKGKFNRYTALKGKRNETESKDTNRN